jgi:hypothetical protein
MPGYAARARSARAGSDVVTATSASPSVAATSGAWKTSPASPKPAMATRGGPLIAAHVG